MKKYELCTSNLTFLSIVLLRSNKEGPFGSDGVLGLSPNITNNDHSFIKTIYDSGIIPKKVVGFYIAD